ncbi:uncharacterized protein [Primulina eburnea]|uniref:uncharacterized protein n=1 Tax=Primulina eburnea TaxID=1245227 RepID=UPI003C6C8A2C
MADKTITVPGNQETFDAISNAEQFLMSEGDNDDPLFDSFLNNTANDPENGYYETNFSEFYLEENRQDQNMGNCSYFQEHSDHMNPMPIPICPVPSSTHSCICCQTLREIFHINGTDALKLEIHGRLGIISHAIEEKYSTDMSSQYHEYQKFDFWNKSISCVKQFLIKYCDDRRQEGYIVLQDPLSGFYEALSIGIDGYGSQDPDLFQASTDMNRKDSLNQLVEEESDVRLTKNYIAAQRERAGKLKLRDLAEYFHLPISAASKEMNICASAIKKICRKEGLSRWPHRKIKSIKSQISKKKKSLNSVDEDERERALAQIHELEQILELLCGENVG